MGERPGDGSPGHGDHIAGRLAGRGGRARHERENPLRLPDACTGTCRGLCPRSPWDHRRGVASRPQGAASARSARSSPCWEACPRLQRSVRPRSVDPGLRRGGAGTPPVARVGMRDGAGELARRAVGRRRTREGCPAGECRTQSTRRLPGRTRGPAPVERRREKGNMTNTNEVTADARAEIEIFPEGHGSVTIDGVFYPLSGGSVEESREEAKRRVAVHAQEAGHPVPIRVLDPDGEFHLIAAPDGGITVAAESLGHPSPQRVADEPTQPVTGPPSSDTASAPEQPEEDSPVWIEEENRTATEGGRGVLARL